LVVIAVIGILASILLPGFASAKRKAVDVGCLHNLHHVTSDWIAAVQEDGGRLGFYGLSTGEPGSEAFQGTAMQKWAAESWGKPAAGWICPAAPPRPERKRATLTFGERTFKMGMSDCAWELDGPASYWWFVQADAPEQHRAGSYAKNDWLGGWWGPPWGPPRVVDPYWDISGQTKLCFPMEGDIQEPSQTPVFADAVYIWAVWPRAADLPATNLRTGEQDGRYVPGMSMITLPRHGSRPSQAPEDQSPSARLLGAINLSFFDGHAERVKLDSLWQQKWHRDYKPPARRPGLQ
jgi:prepilin-type processing-associated H-X9-DG protein